MGRCGATIQNWFSAIEKGDLSLVEKLWKDISDIDVTDTYILNNIKLKWRPIHFAAERGHCTTVDMLCSSGALIDPLTMSLVYHYVCREMLVPDNSSQTQRENVDTALDGSLQLRNQSPPTNSLSVPDASSSLCLNGDTKDFSIAVFDSQVIMNQLQCQSTSYDLELARRKRELIRHLRFLP
ncbi:unnamed protein product, partial [Trichobilharzia regenti]